MNDPILDDRECVDLLVNIACTFNEREEMEGLHPLLRRAYLDDLIGEPSFSPATPVQTATTLAILRALVEAGYLEERDRAPFEDGGEVSAGWVPTAKGQAVNNGSYDRFVAARDAKLYTDAGLTISEIVRLKSADGSGE